MKKMRRLIPAIAMLLVSAVMLSTASFAWFTMNDKVTASGMQIQAKADGSLLISDAPFTSENLGNADLVISAAVQNLYPMAYHDTKAADAADNIGTLHLDTTDTVNTSYASNGWFKPQDNKTSNISTGANSGVYDKLDNANSYAFKQEYYIATAGDPMVNATITVQLKAPVHPTTGETHKAYAAAIYVVPTTNASAWTDNGDITFATDAPDKIIYVGEGNDDTTRNTTTLTANIPSIASAVGDTEVGLKVIVYYYVDGALSSAKTTNVLLGYKHIASDGPYNPDTAYYTFTDATADVSATDVTGYYQKSADGLSYVPVTGAKSATGTYYKRDLAVLSDDDKLSQDLTKYWVVETTTTGTGDDAVTTPTAVYNKLPYTYIRSADIANTPASLELSFSAKVAN